MEPKFDTILTTTQNLKNFGYSHKEWKYKHNGFKREIYNSNGVCVGVADCYEVNEWLKVIK
jgi:hypothetical protein